MDSNLECCVLGCHTKPNQGLQFYRFPCHNPEISSIWEQRISQLANIDFDILNDRVCELHFDYRCKTGNECALEEGSLPTLHLPNFSTLFSTGNAHFQMSANRIEPSYTISIDSLSYHCRFCLRRGLLYEVEASTYRSKSFMSLIDLPPNALPDSPQPNACLTCLKSIVIAHRLSIAVEHSNTVLQLLLQDPKQSREISNTNFFDIKFELAFCNLIIANSLSIKLEIESEDKMVWANEDFEQKLVVTGEPASPVAINTQNIDEKSICIAANQDSVSKMNNSVTSDKQCQKELQKSFAIGGEYTTDLDTEGIPDASQNSDSCVLMENTDDNAQVMVLNNLNDSCSEDRRFGSDQAPEYLNAVNDPTWQTTFTAIDKTHWFENDGVYVCTICDWKTPSPFSFNAHLDKHVQNDNSTIASQELDTLESDPVRNADDRYQWSECPKAFVKKHNFSTHRRIHTTDRLYKCTECLKTFSRQCSLNRHKKIHTNESAYKCIECSKTFTQKSDFSRHNRIHTNERPYKCTECPKTFSQKSNLDTHKRIHTNERPYKCTECPKTFTTNGNFLIHKRIHTSERPYKCTECPKTFSQPTHLSVHKRIHTNERPYKCTECPKTFITKGNFHIHKRVHTSERPYKCTDCQKTFSQKSSLNTHNRIHTNERPYKCTECPKTFSDNSNFSVHMRIHTNERPYKCNKCSVTFITEGNFHIHKRIHVNERPCLKLKL